MISPWNNLSQLSCTFPSFFVALLFSAKNTILGCRHYSSLDELHAFKTGPLDDPLELMEKKKSHTDQDEVNRDVVLIRSRTAECSVLLLFRHAQIFSGNLPNTLLFLIRLTCDHSKSQLMIATYHLPYALNVDLSPACWRPSAPGVIFYLLANLLWTSCAAQKHVYVMWCFLQTLAKAF